jgi:hypothetical protein
MSMPTSKSPLFSLMSDPCAKSRRFAYFRGRQSRILLDSAEKSAKPFPKWIFYRKLNTARPPPCASNCLVVFISLRERPGQTCAEADPQGSQSACRSFVELINTTIHKNMNTLSADVRERALPPIIGEDSGFASCLGEFAERIRNARAPVLFTGETGTGKTAAAHFVFAKSTVYNRLLRVIALSEIPESLFEAQLFGFRRGAFTGAVSDFAGKLKYY